jgi:hypothetical protein
MVAACAIAIAATAGCGGGSSSSDVVNVRTADAVPDGGNATININNGAVGGAHPFETITDYYYLQPASCTFTFSLSANATNYQTISGKLNSSQSYTVLVAGLAAITNPSDPRYPTEAVFNDDTSGASAGNIKIRFVHAAPDWNASTVTVTEASGTDASALAYLNASPYVTLSGPSHTLTITPTNGAAPFQQTISLGTGHSYTLVLMETNTTSPGTYTLISHQDY